MRNIFYFLAALLAFGAAWYYYQDVSARTETITKLRLVAEDGLVIEAGTEIDDDFLDRYVVSQEIPARLAGEFGWALDDSPVTRINLRGRVFGQDVQGGSFLQRGHFFVPREGEFALRIRPGNRAFSVPVTAGNAVENFIEPQSRVDVIATFRNAAGVSEARRLLENVEVMAVGAFASRGEFETEDRPDYTTVTLQAPVDQVEAFLSQSNEADALTLVLRNPCDDVADCVGGDNVTQ